MPLRRHLAAILVTSGLLAAGSPLIARAQTAPQPAKSTTPPDNTAPCYVAPVPDPCGAKPATPAKPAATDKFPFPGETPDTTTPSPTLTPSPAAKKSTQDAFPFPGEDPATPITPDPSPSSSSSSSSSSDPTAPDPTAPDPAATPDPAQPALTDKGSEGTQQPPGRHILHRVNPIGTKLQTNDERESEDLDVAHFYTQTGNLQGAYLRSQDAVKIAPDDPDAHFALAEIARKLNKRDEAIAEYNACLKLDPLPGQASTARKQIARLTASGK
jgi:tetratricopeptide (TPR) repeat protein